MQHHGAGLRRALAAEGVAEEEQDRFLGALHEDPVPPGTWAKTDLALLTYSDKLTRAPRTIVPADIERLQSCGFGDREIHDLCAIVAYYAFVNRSADGLGVELERETGG